jgi:hypothetical protein
MDLETWEHAAPAQLQYWPANAHPTGPGAWDHPRAFASLSEAITAAITDKAPHAHVAWILTSGGRTLKPADIEDLWLQMQSRGTGA